MYTQGLDQKTGGKDQTNRWIEPAEDNAAAFQQRVSMQKRKLKPKDWMPEAYRRTLVRTNFTACSFRDHRHAAGRQLAHQGANFEAQGHTPGQECRTKPAMDSIYIARPKLLVPSRDQMNRRSVAGSGKAKYSSIFNYPTLTWADIGADRLAGRRCGDHEPDPAV